MMDTIDTDAEGYLRDRNDWSRELAEHMAIADDIVLSDAHWEVIEFLQDYYTPVSYTHLTLPTNREV